ncbi:hypothetical protein V474_22805 [Novosphingobium barchaimii LL02]|uniref:Uncharacterized protein n=1 Tax=Novosphingobium barchaimii LL02 TaxID=1114963 RepID=A0A0J7XRE2_9SPHN|nr:hypothetical protein V474_22805 [Novosphingobium barchaimii LL02]
MSVYLFTIMRFTIKRDVIVVNAKIVWAHLIKKSNALTDVEITPFTVIVFRAFFRNAYDATRNYYLMWLDFKR